jgi:hypothetical protein
MEKTMMVMMMKANCVVQMKAMKGGVSLMGVQK